MAAGSGSMEREIKLRFDNEAAARAAVAATGAVLLRPRRLQHDCLLDTAAGQLRDARSILRVRHEPDTSFLTFKGPVQPATMKLREEIETAVPDAAALLSILESLGYRVWFRYEKLREEYRYGDAIIAIDETPVGTFVEIEGSEDSVTRGATALGRGPADYVLASYRTLYVEQRTRAGLPVGDMLFVHG
jgi:adenylate cyclase class 2